MPLAVAQDRLAEKAFLTINRIPVAPFAAIADARPTLEAELAEIGLPAVLKTTRLGYDGKGQRIDPRHARTRRRLRSAVAQAAGARGLRRRSRRKSRWSSPAAPPARSRAFDPAENVHRDHILKTSTVPADDLGRDREEAPSSIADGDRRRRSTMSACSASSSSCSPGGKLLVNEIAPRVHNSGHWTEAVCVTDQFEQHIRAICGWPLGDPTPPRRRGDGEPDRRRDRRHPRARWARHPAPCSTARPSRGRGRKMGHINRIAPKNAREIGVFAPCAVWTSRFGLAYIAAPR